MCHLLDAPFYNSLFDSVVSHNNNFSVGLYLRQLNNKQFQFQNFCTTITSGELNKTAVDIQEEKEQKWSKSEIQAKDAGRNTLTFLMKDMREKDIAGAEANFYDQLRSPGTQWAADMSFKAIKENAFFDENDMQEIFDTQRELIDKFQKESDDAKEKYRLSLIENQRLKELLEDAGIDASAKDTDGDAV